MLISSRPMRNCWWMIVTVLSVLGSAESAAAVELRGDAAGSMASDIVTTRDQVEIALRLDNDNSQPADITLNVRPVRVSGAQACVEIAGCTLALYLLGPGGEQKLNFSEDYRMQIAALGSQRLLLKGSVQGLGRYVVDLAVGEKPTPAVKSIAIRHELRDLPQNALTIGPAGLLSMRYDGSTPAIPIRLAPTTDGVHLDRIATSLLMADASGSFTRPVDWPNSDVRCPSDGRPISQSGISAPPGAPLSCIVRIPDWTWPGAYRLRVEALGLGLKAMENTIEVRVRWPAGFAFSALLVGGLVGAWLASWSQDGRDRLVLAIEAQDVRRQYLDLEARAIGPSSKAQALVNQRMSDLASIVEKLRTGASPTTYADDVTRLRDLLPLIARFAVLEQEFPYPAGNQASYDQTIGEFSKDVVELAIPACRTKLDTLDQALRTAALSHRTSPASPTSLFIFTWERGASNDALRKLRTRNDRGLALVSLLIAILVGMVTLWSNNPTWGSLADWLVAVLTGITITAGGAVSLQQLAQNYQLGSLARRG